MGSTDSGQENAPRILPGKYELFSWAGLQQGIWEDPEFLKEYEAKATVIEVNEGDTKTVELKLIPVKEADVASEIT